MTQMTILDDVFYGAIKSSRKKLTSQLFTNEQKLSDKQKQKNDAQNNNKSFNKKKSKQFSPYNNQRDKLGRLIKNQNNLPSSQQIQKERLTQIESQLTAFKSGSIMPGSNFSKLQTKLSYSFKMNDIDHFPQKKVNQNHKLELIKYKNDVITLYKPKRSQSIQSLNPIIKEYKNPQKDAKKLQSKLHFRSKSVQNIQKSQKLKKSLGDFKEKDIKPQLINNLNSKKKEKQLITAKLNVHFNHQELARYKQIRKLSLKLCDSLTQSQQKYNQNMRTIQKIKQNSIRQLIK